MMSAVRVSGNAASIAARNATGPAIGSAYPARSPAAAKGEVFRRERGRRARAPGQRRLETAHSQTTHRGAHRKEAGGDQRDVDAITRRGRLEPGVISARSGFEREGARAASAELPTEGRSRSRRDRDEPARSGEEGDSRRRRRREMRWKRRLDRSSRRRRGHDRPSRRSLFCKRRRDREAALAAAALAAVTALAAAPPPRGPPSRARDRAQSPPRSREPRSAPRTGRPLRRAPHPRLALPLPSDPRLDAKAPRFTRDLDDSHVLAVRLRKGRSQGEP